MFTNVSCEKQAVSWFNLDFHFVVNKCLGIRFNLTLFLFNTFYHLNFFIRTNFDVIVCSRSSHLEVFLRKAVLKIGSKFTGEHPCRSVISSGYVTLYSSRALLEYSISPINDHFIKYPHSLMKYPLLLTSGVSLNVNR